MPNQAVKTLKTQGYKVFDVKNINNHKQKDIKVVSELEHKILAKRIKAECMVDRKTEKPRLFTLNLIKPKLDTMKEVIKQQNIKETIENYLECEAIKIRQEVFWRNPGGLPITPHQDIIYSKQKHLSVVIPLTHTSVEEGALQYTISEESKRHKHEFSISQHQFYARETGNKKFLVPYSTDQVIVHTPTSLHKARNPIRNGKRCIYIRLMVYPSSA